MVLLAPRPQLLRLSVRKLNVPAVVEPEWLSERLDQVKVVDASFAPDPKKPNHNEFLTKHHGEFDRLHWEKVNKDYAQKHIKGAVHFNLDVGSYPGRFARYELYPPKMFEKYMQRLGLKNNDHIIVYSRGKASGMMFAARVWWMLKLYGHEAVSVLNKGFEGWQHAGLPLSSSPNSSSERGDWRARHHLDQDRMITFEDLTSTENRRIPLIRELNTVNFMDNRHEDQFHGREPLGFPAGNATGSRLKGSKSLPMSSVVDCHGNSGILKKETVKELLEQRSHWDPSLPTILSCNRAVQSCLIALVMEHYHLGRPRVYNGSLEEIAQRSSHLISEGIRKK